MSRYYPVKNIRTNEKVKRFFSEKKDTLVLSCLEGTMGCVYTGHLQSPKTALAILGDFCFPAGEADLEGALFWPGCYGKKFGIIVPPDRKWELCIRQAYGEKAREITRYALKKEKHVWDLDKLALAVKSLPSPYKVQRIDREIYQYAKENTWCQDWVSQFENYEAFRDHGQGVAITLEGIPVAGASSYSYYGEGIEIEIDTYPKYRRKGLAYRAAAALILECERLGLYPSWDAHNKASLSLAQKLGYQLDEPYKAYEIEIK